MESIVNANCTHCGFEKEFYFGAGMMNFETTCNVPAIDKKTGEFVIKNILEREKQQADFLFDVIRECTLAKPVRMINIAEMYGSKEPRISVLFAKRILFALRAGVPGSNPGTTTISYTNQGGI